MKLFFFRGNLKVFYLLALIPMLCSCNFFYVDKTKPEKIHIRKGNITSGELKLRTWLVLSQYTVHVEAGTTLVWLQQADEVKEVTAIYEKKDQHVFSAPPYKIAGTENWEGVVDPNATGTVDYNIDWLDKNGKPHTYDPKIAIRPGPKLDLARVILVILALLISLPAVLSLIRRLRN
jgi:hypothetical protein